MGLMTAKDSLHNDSLLMSTGRGINTIGNDEIFDDLAELSKQSNAPRTPCTRNQAFCTNQPKNRSQIKPYMNSHRVPPLLVKDIEKMHSKLDRSPDSSLKMESKGTKVITKSRAAASVGDSVDTTRDKVQHQIF